MPSPKMLLTIAIVALIAVAVANRIAPVKAMLNPATV